MIGSANFNRNLTANNWGSGVETEATCQFITVNNLLIEVIGADFSSEWLNWIKSRRKCDTDWKQPVWSPSTQVNKVDISCQIQILDDQVRWNRLEASQQPSDVSNKVIRSAERLEKLQIMNAMECFPTGCHDNEAREHHHCL